MTWTLPENIATYGGQIDLLFWIITIVTGIAFVLVEVGIIWFCVKYRRREGHRAFYTHGSKRMEVMWTVIPALAMVVLGIYSAGMWNEIKGRNAAPAESLPVGVAAKQFEWNFTYVGADGVLGTADDFTVRNQLHIPVNQPIVVWLESEDVIHSFFVPQLRVKQDAVPGMTIPAWFEATQTGEYQLGCAELCGLGHYRMRARVVIHEPAAYEEWVRERTATAVGESSGGGESPEGDESETPPDAGDASEATAQAEDEDPSAHADHHGA